MLRNFHSIDKAIDNVCTICTPDHMTWAILLWFSGASILQWPSLDFIQCLVRNAKHFSRPDGKILLLPALKCNPNVHLQPPTMLSASEYKKTWSLLYKNHSWMKWQNDAALNIKALKWTNFSLLSHYFSLYYRKSLCN